jgi:hypothetical protein
MKAVTRPIVVPWIASWSGEQSHRRQVVYSGRGGIAYAAETPEDRDPHGVLWNGRTEARGSGRPQFGDIHPERQRAAMTYLLCQVCGLPADRDDRGVLWLLEDNRGDWRGWPERLMTTHPPICLPCAGAAAAQCPHLERGSVAVRVRDSDACAVYGSLWAPSAFGRPVEAGRVGVVAYGTPGAHWVLAGQLVRALHGCTIVSLAEELRSLP